MVPEIVYVDACAPQETATEVTLEVALPVPPLTVHSSPLGWLATVTE
jgi:hypothetical protein